MILLDEERVLKKEEQYIEKLTDRLTEKMTNTNDENNSNIIQQDNKNKYVFLKPYQYYNENPKVILDYIKNIYIKSDIGYDNIYKPRPKTVMISLSNIVKKIENDNRYS